MPKDFLNQELMSGDAVVFMQYGQRIFSKGILISNKPLSEGKIKYSKNTWDTPSKQKYHQLIKITDPILSNEVKNKLL